METSKTKLGADHPDTRDSMNNLAITWKRQGKAREALALLEECIIRCQRSCLGIDPHPYMQSVLQTLNSWRARSDSQ
jgi:hypothetical protein